MSPLVLLATLALAGSVATLATPRQPRWFIRVGTVTRMVTESVVVTQMTPSSCVEVAPSLDPCQHVPHDISPSPTTTPRIEPTPYLAGGRAFWDGWLASSNHHPEDDLVAPTPQVSVGTPGGDVAGGWQFNRLFDGLYSTVTQTVVEKATARIDDVEHVITFSVVGCLPSQLPFNLPLCEDGVGRGVEAGASQNVEKHVVPAVVGPDPRSVA